MKIVRFTGRLGNQMLTYAFGKFYLKDYDVYFEKPSYDLHANVVDLERIFGLKVKYLNEQKKHRNISILNLLVHCLLSFYGFLSKMGVAPFLWKMKWLWMPIEKLFLRLNGILMEARLGGGVRLF